MRTKSKKRKDEIKRLRELSDYKEELERSIDDFENVPLVYTKTGNTFGGQVPYKMRHDASDNTKELLIGMMRKELRSTRAKIGSIKL